MKSYSISDKVDVLYELIELLPSSFQPPFSPKLNEFYFLLREKRYSEEEAMQHFLSEKPSKKYFNKLKSKLKKGLINCILVSPTISTDTLQRELNDTCQKEFAIYKILLAKGSRITAIKLAINLLAKVQRLELYELAYIIAYDLEFHYAGIEVTPTKFKKFNNIVNKYLDLIKAERLIRIHYCRTMQIYNTKNKFSANDLKVFKEAEKNVLPLLALKSGKLNRLIYNIVITRYYVEHNYLKVLYYCEEALQSFPKDHPNALALRFAFLNKKILALIALKKFEKAKDIAEEAGKMMPVGKFNWHLILIQRIVICFHSGAFQEAYELYKAQMKHPCAYSLLAEYWNVIRGYLHLLIETGHIEPYTEERFNLGKFLNEIPLFSQDKAGVNINVLLIQIITQLHRKQFGRIIDRTEALRAYAQKHIRQPETARAYYFINMILKMDSTSFHLANTERKSQKLLKQLQETPLRFGQSIAVEIVPYETLWEIILGMLDNKFRAVKLNKKIDTQNQ